MNVVARVNGEPIYQDYLEKNVSRYLMQLEEDEEQDFKPTVENMKYIRVQVLNYLIERMLVLQTARRNGIYVTDEELNLRIQNFRSQFATQEEWERELSILKTCEKDLACEIQDDMIIEKYLDTLFNEQIDLSEENLQRFFYENRSQLFLSDLYTFYEAEVSSAAEIHTVTAILTDSDNSTLIRQKFESLGVPFQHSVDVPAYQIPIETLNILSDLEEGKLGTMVVDNNRLVVYKLIRRVNGRIPDYKEVKQKLAKYLLEQGKREIYSNLVNRELENADLEYLNIAYVEGK